MNARDSIISRPGFTLVELLVVVGVIGVLMSLLLPAVQQSRGSARTVQCGSHIRQLGVAAKAFTAVRHRLPPGYLGPTPPGRGFANRPAGSGAIHSDQHLGVLGYLLPHLEQSAVHDRIEVSQRVREQKPPWWRDTSTWNIAQAKLAIFRCPAADSGPPTVSPIVSLHTYHDPGQSRIVLSGTVLSGGSGKKLGLTNYLGNAGRTGVIKLSHWDRHRGVFFNRSLTTPAHIRDGGSNTLLFGEAVGHVDGGALQYGYSWMGAGAMPVEFGFGQPRWHQFSSRHTGRVNFCFADGSVRGLSPDVERATLRALAGMSDGETVDSDQL